MVLHHPLPHDKKIIFKHLLLLSMTVNKQTSEQINVQVASMYQFC